MQQNVSFLETKPFSLTFKSLNNTPMVGSSIKRLRRVKNITQKELADWLGVSRQAISMWEAEKRELKATTLNKIAKVFGVTVDEMMQINQKPLKGKEANMWKRGEGKNQVTFELMAPAAKKVAVTGDFKNWDKSGIAMKKSKDGVWKANVTLKQGRYEYKFIVDSDWQIDPSNSVSSKNSFGSLNSVLELSA